MTHATIVPDAERLDFIPELVTENYVLRFESYVYGFADHYYKNYKGGYWDFYRVPGSGFMALRHPDLNTIQVGRLENFFNEDVDSITAGIIATLYSLGYCMALASHRGDDTAVERMNDAYYSLLDWACQNSPDAQQIIAAID